MSLPIDHELLDPSTPPWPNVTVHGRSWRKGIDLDGRKRLQVLAGKTSSEGRYLA